MADLKTSKITRLKIGYANNESYLLESDSTALDILGDARITGNTNLYGNLNIIKDNINLFQLNQDGVTIPTLNVSNLSTTILNINGSSFTDIQNNINNSISSSSITAETNAKKFASSEIANLNKSHTAGKYISSISAPNGNGNSAAIAVNETAFDSTIGDSSNGISASAVNSLKSSLVKSHTTGSYISAISAGSTNNELSVSETAFDDFTSTTSINGVQNKVITNYINTQINNLTNINDENSLASKINAKKMWFASTPGYSWIDASSSNWNDGKIWMIVGCDYVTLRMDDETKTFYCPCFFSSGSSSSSSYINRIYNHDAAPGHPGTYTEITEYYASAEITINGVGYSKAGGARSYSYSIVPRLEFSHSNAVILNVTALF